MAKHMHCIVQEGLSCFGIQHLNNKVSRNCASTRWDSSDDAVTTSNKAMYLHLTQAVVCLPVTDMVGKDDVHDRRIYSHHHSLAWQSRYSCNFFAEIPFTAEWPKSDRLFLGNGSVTDVTHFDSSSSTNRLYFWSWLMVFTFITVPATHFMIYLVSRTRKSLRSSKNGLPI